jgi:hypothetical protein
MTKDSRDSTFLGLGSKVSNEDLHEGIEALDKLSREDYGLPLSALYAASDDEAIGRLGRLIGVSLKQPFATPVLRAEPSKLTGSHRDWELNVSALDSEALATTWQHRALVALSSDLGYSSVVAFAQDAHHEAGFFGLFAASLKKYICGDPKIRKRVRTDVAAAKARGINTNAVTPETVVASGGAALASYLIVHVPLMAFVGAPVIVGVVLILYRIGIDAFCGSTEPMHVRE